jgi:hypothetical protein
MTSWRDRVRRSDMTKITDRRKISALRPRLGPRPLKATWRLQAGPLLPKMALSKPWKRAIGTVCWWLTPGCWLIPGEGGHAVSTIRHGSPRVVAR